MTLTEAILLGIVEGLTEFLPISSTGHLILTAHILRIPQTEFVKSFEIAIQLGAILAVLILYLERFLKDFNLWKRIIVAFIPTGLVGFLFYRIIKGLLIGNDLVVVLSLFAGGIVLILVDGYSWRWKSFSDPDELSLRGAFLIGLFQSMAAVPGVSRSGSSIVGGMIAGLSRKGAAEFSFILAVPTMAAATGYDLMKNGFSFLPSQWILLLVGFATAFFTAMITVKLFLRFLGSHGFTIFGVYRILAALLYGLVFL